MCELVAERGNGDVVALARHHGVSDREAAVLYSADRDRRQTVRRRHIVGAADPFSLLVVMWGVGLLETFKAGLYLLMVVVPLLVGPGTSYSLSIMAIWGLVAVSLVVLTGWGGQISLGQFALVGVGAIVAGNLVAILLEGTIAAVQALRLEYYEFFGKFFAGGGLPFSPFRLNEEGRP